MRKDAKSDGQDGDRLDSWKKIAAYLGKDVRTAMRWSKDEGMPVYRHNEGKRGAIYAYRSEIDEWIHSDRSASPRLSRKPVFLGIGAVAVLGLAIAGALLWLTPSTDQPDAPVAERPWVLITDFDNHSGEARFDGTLETAMRRELANSRHVLVVAPERVRDSLALMKRAPDVTIDAELGREICLRYGGNCAVLTGRVEKFAPSYLFSIEVLDAADGRSVASAAEEAAGDSEVLPAVHRLSDWLRKHLGEELAQITRSNEELERVTTPSLRAVGLYSRGMRLMYLLRMVEAEVLFRQAVDEDPEFASANLFVFWTLANQNKAFEDEAQFFLARAMDLADSASEQERYFIKGTYYEFAERNHEKSCGSWKNLAELFPDHFWAAGNAAIFCGGALGHREALVRYSIQAAELRVDMLATAAVALTLIDKDFDQARPYVERLKDAIADGGVPGWKSKIAFTEFFAAEEFLNKGLLTDVASELQRVEMALESMDASLQRHLTYRLVKFHIALGQFQKARTLGHEAWFPSRLPAWLAFLEGDQSAFQVHVQKFYSDFSENHPDPTRRLTALLGQNVNCYVFQCGVPIDVLAPLYDADTAVAMVTPDGEPPLDFLSYPLFKAKLQLVRGKQLLDQGRLDEAKAALRSSVLWFRDYGDWRTFRYYFLGAEFLAVTLAGQDDLPAAFRVLEQAGENRNLVNSISAPLYQRVQARQALLARELGRTAEAEVIETELAAALRLADRDHPILMQIREQQIDLLEIE